MIQRMTDRITGWFKDGIGNLVQVFGDGYEYRHIEGDVYELLFHYTEVMDDGTEREVDEWERVTVITEPVIG